jgi:hypothetical protein
VEGKTHNVPGLPLRQVEAPLVGTGRSRGYDTTTITGTILYVSNKIAICQDAQETESPKHLAHAQHLPTAMNTAPPSPRTPCTPHRPCTHSSRLHTAPLAHTQRPPRFVPSKHTAAHRAPMAMHTAHAHTHLARCIRGPQPQVRLRVLPLARIRIDLHSCRRNGPGIFSGFVHSHMNRLANVISYLGPASLLERETTLDICDSIHGVTAVQVALGFNLVLEPAHDSHTIRYNIIYSRIYANKQPRIAIR